MLSISLAALSGDGDRARFTALYERHSRRMTAAALGILSSRTRAEDAVHDAWLKAIEHFEDLKRIPEERQGYWLVAVTRNTALDMLRKEGWETPTEDGGLWPAPGAPAEGDGFARLVELIRAMPQSYRQVLELRFVEEWSHADIARALHTSEGAVKTRVSRGRQLLIQRLKEEGYLNGGTGV